MTLVLKWRDPGEVFQQWEQQERRLGGCKEPAWKKDSDPPGLSDVLYCRDRETEAQAGAEMAQVLQGFVVDPACLMDSVGVRGRLSPGPGRAPLPHLMHTCAPRAGFERGRAVILYLPR